VALGSPKWAFLSHLILTRAFHRINPCVLCREIRLARLQNARIIMRVQFGVAEKPRFGCPLDQLLIRLWLQKIL
jgi:hypothetical protein